MAIGLDPVTVEEAGPIMARVMNLDWENNRREVISYLNKYRLLLYTMYDEFKLFDNAYHCICPTLFRQECGTGCVEDPTYRGFTLPNDILSVEAIWDWGRPLTLRTRWREAHVGIETDRLPRLDAVPVDENFCTERDLTVASRIKIFTESDKDDGKKVYMDVITESGKQKRITFSLIGDGFALSKMKVTKILNVMLPASREGFLTLTQADGYVLSMYVPGEASVPTYRRLKLAKTCSTRTVLVKGVKRFQNVYLSCDIVEVGNQLIIESAGRYFKYNEASTETKEIQRAQYDLKEMKTLLLGLQARHRGNEIQDNNPVQAYRPSKRPLPGYRR